MQMLVIRAIYQAAWSEMRQAKLWHRIHREEILFSKIYTEKNINLKFQ